MRHYVLAVAIAIVLLSNPTLGATVKEGWEALQRGEYHKAETIFRSLAKNGDPVAENNLGYMRQRGLGLERDFDKAAYWYERAAVKGYGRAQINLAYFYLHGRSVTRSQEEAVKWFTKAAESGWKSAQYNLGKINDDAGRYGQARQWYKQSADQGYAPAQINLGILYVTGRGGPMDRKAAEELFYKAVQQDVRLAYYWMGEVHQRNREFPEAIRWYEKAAERGDEDAMFIIGSMYSQGEDVDQDPERAFQWFLKAAKLGHASSQFNVGSHYHQGRGVAKDEDEAFKWLSMAAAQNHDAARHFLKKWFP